MPREPKPHTPEAVFALDAAVALLEKARETLRKAATPTATRHINAALNSLNNDLMWRRDYPYAKTLIEDMPLSTRTSNALRRESWPPGQPSRFVRVDDLLKCTSYELLRIPNFGRLALKEVEVELAAHGFKLLSYRERES